MTVGEESLNLQLNSLMDTYVYGATGCGAFDVVINFLKIVDMFLMRNILLKDTFIYLK